MCKRRGPSRFVACGIGGVLSRKLDYRYKPCYAPISITHLPRITMRLHLRLFCLALLGAIGGCVSTSTQMVNDDGLAVNCGAWGIGLIGAPAALISTNECVKKYKAAGYHETGSPVAVNSTAAAQPATSPITLTSKDGAFKLYLPAGWVQATPPSQAYQFYTRNQTLDAGLLVSTVDAKDIQDWQLYAESLRLKLASNLTQATLSEPEKTVVNGLEAFRAEVTGVAKNGLKLHYLSTLIKADRYMIYLVSWSLESKFESNKVALMQLANGVQL